MTYDSETKVQADRHSGKRSFISVYCAAIVLHGRNKVSMYDLL